MNRRYLPPLFFLALALGMIAGMALERSQTPSETPYRGARIDELLNLIDRDYLKPINTDSLLDVVMDGLLRELDPHSVYLSGADAEEATGELEGILEGIGIEFRIYRDTAVVMELIEGGPAQSAGLQRGDRIYRIDKNTYTGPLLSTDALVNALRGPKGTTVELTVRRASRHQKQTLRLKRDRMQQSSVSSALMLESDIAYIRLERFSEDAYPEMRHQLEQLLHKGMRKLVLDLRGNPGGYMQSAQGIADEFLAGDAVIVRTENREGLQREYRATQNGFFEVGAMAVLLDEESASASEVLAGALQDHERATVVGRRSFGKGLVQEEVALSDGSKVRLTHLRYFTPSGRSLQRSYEQGDQAYYEEAVRNRLDTGGVELGGIRPDVFVPDTLSPEEWTFYAQIPPDSVQSLSMRFWDANRMALNRTGAEAWMRTQRTEMTAWNSSTWTLLARALPLELHPWAFERFKQEVLYRAFAHEERAVLELKTDPDVQKALELLKNKTP